MLSDIERAAWARRTDADKHPPELACKVAIDEIERGVISNVKHIVVIVVRTVDDIGDKIMYYQAGELSEFAIEGVFARCVKISQES
jgi:hypothetical protein